MQRRLPTFLRTFFYRISGNTKEFTLENRLFNIVTFAGSFLLVLTFINNYFLGLDYKMNLAITGLFILHAFLYYKARFKKQSRKVILPYLIITTILFSAAWFFNAGSNGPMILLFYNLTLLTICITPYKQHIFWVGLTTVIGLTLYVVELNFPSTVIPYTDESQKISDMIFAFLVGNIITFILIRALKNSYDHERFIVEEQNLLIKNQNIYLENSNLVKDKLFTVLAHDLRSPLTSLRSMMNVFEDEIKSNDEMREIASAIDDRLKYNLQLLDDLMIWSNTKHMHKTAEKTVFDIYELVDYVYPIFKPMADKKNIACLVNASGKMEVYADKNMIKSVLRNLISNAVKFTEPGGSVTLSATLIGSHVQVVVADTGKGMNPEILKSIFSEAHFSTLGTANETGSGIGLLLCQGFIQQNGSELKIESEVGVGTKISFDLILAEDKF